MPVLLLEGEDDLRTPVENARRVAGPVPALAAGGRAGHGPLGARVGRQRLRLRAFARFLQAAPCAGALPARASRLPARAAAAGARWRRSRRFAGPRGLRGRALAAVELTLEDVAEDSLTELILDPHDPDIARGGGLRAGRYRVDGDNTLTLRGGGLRARA